MDDAARTRFVRSLTRWYAGSARDLPWRRPGFGAWGILVSEVMLQQTPVSRVRPILKAWLERWPTPADLAAASPGDAIAAWQNLGYPRRALRLHACARAIVDEHGGIVPNDVHSLLRLPGIGEYTARAVSVFAYGTRHPVVDTNVRRVLARAVEGRESAGPPSAARDQAAMAALLPKDAREAAAFDAAAMELGATVCTARNPRCGACPIADLCRWRAAGYPRETTVRRPAPRYEGSDRQARGTLLKLVRLHAPVSEERMAKVLPENARRRRALHSLLADGLLVETGHGYTLPG